MARLDPLIDRLVSEFARELSLQSGAGAILSAPHGEVPIIKQPLTTQQIVGALTEILPADLKAGFPRAGTTVFRYLAPAGAVEVRVEYGDGRIRAVVSPREEEAAPEVPAPAPAASPRPPPARARSRPAVLVPPAPPAATVAPDRFTPIAAPPEPHAAMAALLEAMVARKASDLHLSSGTPPTFRIDGDIVADGDYGVIGPERVRDLLWSIAPERNREEWLQRKDSDFAHETEAARFRVNVFADRKGIGAVLRQIPASILSAKELGLPQAVLDLCFLQKGLVLVTGPTGSGKSTTLAAMLDHVNRNRDDHVITIEDPIEFVHQNRRCLVNQREVGVHTGSFKAALRAALREDPDVVLVGELRDLETIAIAIETAETGHLVFGTLHTNTAPSTVDRVIDQFPADRQEQIRMMLSESLKGVIAQTLCKRIGGGRSAALEILLCTSSVANLIREGKTFQIASIMQTGRGQGMVTLNDSLLDLVKRGVVEAAEALRRSVARSELRGMLERAGVRLDEAPTS
jgi:twitching motility protein PilT